MRAITPALVALVALLALAGIASAQNAPCPECDPDGEPVDNSYHSVDLGVVEEDSTELLADTDVSYAPEESEKGFWAWLSICLSAFTEKIGEALGIHTDVDANVEVYADSEGVDVDASLYGLQHVCDAVGVQTECDASFDGSPVGDADGMTYQAIAAVEATTGQGVHVPAVVPSTDDSDTDVCVKLDVSLC